MCPLWPANTHVSAFFVKSLRLAFRVCHNTRSMGRLRTKSNAFSSPPFGAGILMQRAFSTGLRKCSQARLSRDPCLSPDSRQNCSVPRSHADQGIGRLSPFPDGLLARQDEATSARASKLDKASHHELLPLEGYVGAVKPSEKARPSARKIERETGPRGKKALSLNTFLRAYRQTNFNLDPPHCAFPAHRPGAVVLVSVPITVPVAPSGPRASLGNAGISWVCLVGVAGFEPATPSSRTRAAP
jgi:hypothetical protein